MDHKAAEPDRLKRQIAALAQTTGYGTFLIDPKRQDVVWLDVPWALGDQLPDIRQSALFLEAATEARDRRCNPDDPDYRTPPRRPYRPRPRPGGGRQSEREEEPA